MADRAIAGRRILVVEDDYLIASTLAEALQDRHAKVVGPVGSIEGAMRLIHDTPDLEGAFLDVNLRGVHAFPVADALLDRNVPFVFTTGYDKAVIPDRYAHIARCEKPSDLAAMTAALFA